MIYTYIIPMPNLRWLNPTISGGSAISAEAIINDLCDCLRISRKTFMTKSKREDLKSARWIFWKIMLSHGYTLREVGAMMEGHKYDHTTIIHAMRMLPDDVDKVKSVHDMYLSVMHWDKEPYTIEPCQ